MGFPKNYNSPLHSKTKKCKTLWVKKNTKITKQSHTFKHYASSYNVKILKPLNLQWQLKDIQSAIKK